MIRLVHGFAFSAMLCACAAAPPRSTRPAATIWLSVEGATDAELAAIREGAQAWEAATRGALALPITLAPRGAAVHVTVDDYAPDHVSAGTVAWTVHPRYDQIHLIRPRIAKDFISCAMAHELGHVLRREKDHDLWGLMAGAPTDCNVTELLANEAIKAQESK